MGDDSTSRSIGAQAASRRRASEIIEDFVTQTHDERIAVGALTEMLGDRAFGMLALVLALPNIIPLPGLSTLTGAPIAVLGAQLAMGKQAPRLPRRLAAATFSRDALLGVLKRAHPSIERVERRFRPRLPWFTHGPGERLAGAAMALLGAVLSLPVVFGNLPPAAAIAVIALGLIEKDGLVVVLGLVLGVIAVILVTLIVLSLGGAALHVAAQAFPFLFLQAPP
jgi:hypothetical protein